MGARILLGEAMAERAPVTWVLLLGNMVERATAVRALRKGILGILTG